jgi:intracellular sulfur oxidation DsrE/DsrF family protein
MKETFSDEYLNAYLDNQLEADERAQLLDELRRDGELSERVCKLQKVKEMVQLAYHNFDAEQDSQQPRQHKPMWPAIAASFLLAIGILTGWFANSQIAHQPSLLELAKASQTSNTKSNAHEEWRIVLHVDSADPDRYNVMLDETEQLLKTSAQQQQKVRVEILTNGGGLMLVENGNEPYTKRLRSLTKQYDNLGLLVCQRALNKFKAKKGVQLDLLPEARVVESAMNEVIKRQQEGWAYIRI